MCSPSLAAISGDLNVFIKMLNFLVKYLTLFQIFSIGRLKRWDRHPMNPTYYGVHWRSISSTIILSNCKQVFHWLWDISNVSNTKSQWFRQINLSYILLETFPTELFPLSHRIFKESSTYWHVVCVLGHVKPHITDTNRYRRACFE